MLRSERSTEPSAQGLKPRRRKPDQRDYLKRKANSERSLVGNGWVVAILRQPLPDNQTNSVLDCECPAEMQQIQRPIGACGKLRRETIRYHCITQDGCRA